MTDEDMLLLFEAISHFGTEAQKKKAIEEMAELIQALAKDISNEAIVDEIADVWIMTMQLMLIYKEYAPQERVKFKLERLRERMKV